MEIRPAQRADIRVLAELWAHAFPGERTVEQRVRQLEAGGVYGGVETAFLATGGESSGMPAGGFRAYRLRQHMHGAVLPMMGVAAVAVAAHARRRGLGASLCREALRIGRERGDVLSVLYPFRPSFYEALGWGLCGSLRAHRFRPESLPVYTDNPGVMLLHEPAELVASCYDAVASKSNGLIERSGRMWRQHLDWPDVHVFALRRGSECRGYMIVHYGHGATADARTLTVRELMATDDASYRALLSWISLQRDSWRMVEYDAAPAERFDLRLTEPRTPGLPPSRTLFDTVARVIRGPMLRVLNVVAAIEMRRRWGIVTTPSFTMRIEVADAELPENARPLVVEWRDGRARVTGDGAATDADATLRADATTFAQIYAGEITIGEAVALGRAECSGRVADATELWRADREFMLYDEF